MRLAAAVLLLLALPAGSADDRRSGFDFMSPSTQAMQRDDSLNPAMLWVRDGERQWSAKAGHAERSCADCHGELARSMKGLWNPSDTDVFVLDTLSNGTLYALEEGELDRVAQPEDLLAAAKAASVTATQRELESYVIPAGATDALPFLVEGYRALALTCIDPEQHAPRNYHHPNDTADRVDPEQLEASTAVAWALIESRSKSE